MDIKNFFESFYSELGKILGFSKNEIEKAINSTSEIFFDTLSKKLDVHKNELERVAKRILVEKSNEYIDKNDIEQYSFDCPCYDLHYELKIITKNSDKFVTRGPIFCPTCGKQIRTLEHPVNCYQDYPERL